MGAVADGKVIVAVLQHPSALCAVCLDSVFVIACKISGVKFNRHFFGSARSEKPGLFKSNQLNSGFLKPAGFVRCLYIELYNRFACHIAGVGNGCFGGTHTAYVNFDGVELLLKRGV